MQRPGFNIERNDGNKARFGYCTNCPSQACQNADSDDADASIGIGLAGQSTSSEMGGGWTEYFASGAGTCNANSAQAKNVWLYVLPQPELWKLAMKTNGDSTWGYSESIWESDTLLNENQEPNAAGNAKYAEYLNTPFSNIKLCVGSDAGSASCMTHAMPRSFASLKQLFNAGFVRQEGISQDDIYSVFGPSSGSYQPCGMQRPGFNIQCNDGNKARFGFCNNCASQPCQTSDSNDADSAIGIGLAGQSTSGELGAGWTAYFASGSGTCSANSKTEKNAWLYILPEVFTLASEWTLVMKTNGDSTWGYSESLWTNDALLNENDADTNAGNSKYAAYLTTPVSKIKVCVGLCTSCCFEHTLSGVYTSTKALFSAGYIADSTLPQDEILSSFAVPDGTYAVCGMQRPGFNIQCNDGNKARFGFCNNCASQPCQTSDSNDADAAIGIGLAGQSTSGEMGGGWTEYFASGSGTCSANSKQTRNVWLFVM
jgi:hypothetical protein